MGKLEIESYQNERIGVLAQIREQGGRKRRNQRTGMRRRIELLTTSLN